MFTFPLEPSELFAERRRQFLGWGVPEDAVAAVEARITDMWEDAPGGWPYEWSRAAEALVSEERWLEAALTYGAARFPCLATGAHVQAYHRQLEAFERAAADVDVEREVVAVDHHGARLDVPVHRYRRDDARAVLVLTGGVDTWKVEIHRIASAFRTFGELEVVAFDMPGTGECDTALRPDADDVYAQVIAAARRPSLPVGTMGISFAGMWAAKLALLRRVDFAIDLGGPIGAEPPPPDQMPELPNGMAGIVAHALRFDEMPTPQQLRAALDGFSLAHQGLLGPDRSPAPLLVVNGSEDVYLPAVDTTVFRQYAEADVELVPDAGHCAAEKITDVIAGAIGWIERRTTTSGSSLPVTGHRSGGAS